MSWDTLVKTSAVCISENIVLCYKYSYLFRVIFPRVWCWFVLSHTLYTTFISDVFVTIVGLYSANMIIPECLLGFFCLQIERWQWQHKRHIHSPPTKTCDSSRTPTAVMMRRFRTDCSLLMIPLTTLSVTDLTVSLPNECPNYSPAHLSWCLESFPPVYVKHIHLQIQRMTLSMQIMTRQLW